MPNAHLAVPKPRANISADHHIADLVVKARTAMGRYAAEIAASGQARIDEAVTALAWSIYKPQNARALAEIAVEVTGIGEVASKVVKNQRKTFGTLRDLLQGQVDGRHRAGPRKGHRQIRQAGGRGRQPSPRRPTPRPRRSTRR